MSLTNKINDWKTDLSTLRKEVGTGKFLLIMATSPIIYAFSKVIELPFQTKIFLEPKNPDNYISFAQDSVYLGSSSKKRIKILSKGIRQCAPSAELLENRALEYLQLEQYQNAETDYREALSLDPKNTKIISYLANTLWKQYKDEEAEKYKKQLEDSGKNYDPTIEIETRKNDNIKSANNKSLTTEDVSEMGLADYQDYLNKAYPERFYSEKYFERAEYFVKNNDLEKAVENYAKAIQTAEIYNPMMAFQKGWTLLQLKKFTEARTDFEEVQKNTPSSAYGLWGLGNISLEEGDYAQALQKFNEAITITNVNRPTDYPADSYLTLDKEGNSIYVLSLEEKAQLLNKRAEILEKMQQPQQAKIDKIEADRCIKAYRKMHHY